MRRKWFPWRQEGSDARAHVGVVFLARNEDEDGDEAIELVSPGQRPQAGALVENQDLHDEIVEGLDVDLDDLVTRIIFENVQERLARMAVRIEAGALEHQRHLVADIRDLAYRASIGARGEQTDETQLALQLAVGRIEFDADVVHPYAAMNAAAHVGLDDDEEGRLAPEFANFRRHHHHFGAAA